MCKIGRQVNHCAAFGRWWRWRVNPEFSKKRLVSWQALAESIDCQTELSNSCRLEVLLHQADWYGRFSANFFSEFAQEPDKLKMWQERADWLRVTFEKIVQGHDEKHFVSVRAPYSISCVVLILPVGSFFQPNDVMSVEEAAGTLDFCSMLLEDLTQVLPNRITQHHIHYLLQWCEMAFRAVTLEQTLSMQQSSLVKRTRLARAFSVLTQAVEAKKQRVASILATCIQSLDMIRHVVLPFNRDWVKHCAAFSRWYEWWQEKQRIFAIMPWQTLSESMFWKYDHELTDICRLEILFFLTRRHDFWGKLREFADAPKKLKIWQDTTEWMRTTFGKIVQGDNEQYFVLKRVHLDISSAVPIFPVRAFFRPHGVMSVDDAVDILELCSLRLDDVRQFLPNSAVHHQILQWCEVAFCAVTLEQAIARSDPDFEMMLTRAFSDLAQAVEARKQRVASILATCTQSLDVIRHVILPYVGV